jgi:hypothetical protein
MDQPVDPDTANTVPLCPECLQPASVSLAGRPHSFECRNEACPEFGAAAFLDSDNGSYVVDHIDDEHPAGPTP